MEKPISIKRAELQQKLEQTIGQSELPPCVVADLLQLVLLNIQALAQAQLQKDIEEYRNAVEEEKEGKNNDN